MNIAIADLPDLRVQLFPLTMTRPVGSLRVGILTIQEKWSMLLGQDTDLLSTELLNAKFQKGPAPYQLIVNGSICPDEKLVDAIYALEEGYALYGENGFIAAKGNFSCIEDIAIAEDFHRRQYGDQLIIINRTWDIFLNNGDQIISDYALLTKGKQSQSIADAHTVIYGRENMFVEEGVKVRAAVLNAESGPIYLSKGSEIQEGAIIKGPFYLGEGSKVNMGAKIRESTSVGPWCKVGGEVSNSIIYAYSNKGHDGFLGNSVLGEFCNLGAATNNSNLKNNYDHVKMWDYQYETLLNTNLTFCGLVMGDHSKSAIGVTFNTGTSVGVSCNVFGEGFPQKHVPSFSWGGASKMVVYDFEKAMETAQRVMSRRDIDLTPTDKEILKSVFDSSS